MALTFLTENNKILYPASCLSQYHWGLGLHYVKEISSSNIAKNNAQIVLFLEMTRYKKFNFFR